MNYYKTIGSMASVEICVKFVKNCFLIYFQELDEFFYGHKKTVSLKVIPFINGADGRSRTGTALATTPSRWRVYQFHHVGK